MTADRQAGARRGEPKRVALVVAAGRGYRLGGELPKQYLTLGGRPILRHCLAVFAAHPDIAAVRAVIHPDDQPLYDQAARGLDLLDPVPGGAERQDSVRLGLESLADLAPDQVLIHDAARPFLTPDVVDRVIAALDEQPGAIPAVAQADTLKRVGADGLITGTVDRSGLWRAQTPQGFRFPDLLAAHRAAAGQTLTDDAAVLEAAGGAVRIVPGAERNVKITTVEDLRRAERRFQGPGEVRVGSGFDVHAVGPGDHVTLGGIRIPYEHGLVGHSDADVGLHAVTDAIYGAIAAGDIGRHFPPTDERWKGAPSDVFLRHAGALVEALGGRILHLDLTLICERPKVGPRRAAITSRIAEILGLDGGRVAVKATTTEQLGFTGRGEGIAAQATATVSLPG
ncbi:bifunctional 2-C-methyl-D-erythritol 4-phosphate cytidylyltransferase/2-C-methyl-D-erythritol 2,4-cyclodiphosphate synthase [Roseospira marina]|uniref:Bifunctional enzyme IspD/IspF n=1 Tax=Roseospira marina TaxID=140057 RepID=A0A5M6IGM2_9PROT|nr:bifunctional 2-C-methyl-D-erythritol 4-phosphate cytidylyltransferase/2-C-methyl-D-erythritol 2,4-cyclodiphosphate synthase [Roseospira marina]KAA5607312.1 bifunctional 2-C-methyl-D-erythritol 4-phosphate cytidylyltransferase/2-C-methyl-D-erythritol 2,4-cyclodiphosphate synthase [Roseospira marina]MBB4312530.1 2-C-methyl-D-erythritol 4-phosphate cytidylyltransferase/2-C-methyl-D-erythritol 2,4-cyclodiphosphate synthase [Roseospira marina]MBB5085454.1 2-C-methyl-D-erythritol 4-phosphate cytidy